MVDSYHKNKKVLIEISMRTFLRTGGGQLTKLLFVFFIYPFQEFFDELSNEREENVSYYN